MAACSNSTSLQHCKYFLGQWAWLLPIIIVIPLNSGHWTLSSHWTLSWFRPLTVAHSLTYRVVIHHGIRLVEHTGQMLSDTQQFFITESALFMSSIPVIATAVVLIMLKNIGNAISRLPMDRFGRNLSGRNTSCPRCGCHGKGRCLATAHWTFCSYGRLKAGSVNQFWWNLVHNSRFGSQWQSHDQILNFFYIQDGRQPPYWKILEML